MSESYIPEGYQHVIPYFAVKDAGAALDFYSRAFGASEVNRITLENGVIAHAEMRIGDAVYMFSTASAEHGHLSAEDMGGSPVSFVIYVSDCDTSYSVALDEGAKGVMPPADMFWGDRSAKVQDPFGYSWMLNTNKEKVSQDEAQKRMRALFAKAA